ncbi:MAG TPA: GIY-YIG nuclease family protein [Bryobacteraceae bacterium]|jgi:hypothetical protein
MPKGFVYILVSPNSDYIKIGGTEQPIRDRLREINLTDPYADHGPWQLSDFLQVTDWQLVEGKLHRRFREARVQDVPGARELFTVPPHAARKELRLTDAILRVDHERTAKLFANRDLQLYLFKIFEFSGLFGSLDIQGAWTLNILPSTSQNGRWFTLNIGPHEVAFSTRRSAAESFDHRLVLDRLILDYPETILWVGRHDGNVQAAHYASAEHAVSIGFRASFAEAEKVFGLPGVRRALVAYWWDRLADLRERNAKSSYARYHSYDAVAELLEYKHVVDKHREA